jgi:hypothetical protein
VELTEPDERVRTFETTDVFVDERAKGVLVLTGTPNPSVAVSPSLHYDCNVSVGNLNVFEFSHYD